MLVLQEAEEHMWRARIAQHSLLRNVLNINRHARPRLPKSSSVNQLHINVNLATAYLNPALLLRAFQHRALRAPKVLELEYPCIVLGEVLVRVPRARPEGPQPAVPLEARARGDVLGRVDLVGERAVVLFFAFAISPVFEPASSLSL